MNTNKDQPSDTPHSSAVVVQLKMEGSKRNRAKVQRMIESAINETLKDMTWQFVGKGKVEVEWEIAVQDNADQEKHK